MLIPTAEVPSNIPTLYRILFLYIEPVAIISGAIQSFFTPTKFAVFLQPTSTTVSKELQIVFSYLSANYFLLAWLEAVVLRCTSSLKVWKVIQLGIFLSDAFHLYASANALGSTRFWDPRKWRAEDRINLGLIAGNGTARLMFLLGVGMRSVAVEKLDR